MLYSKLCKAPTSSRWVLASALWLGSWLAAYLQDMRQHMPPAHRAFVAQLEAGTSLRSAVEAASSDKGLKVGGAWCASWFHLHKRVVRCGGECLLDVHHNATRRSATRNILVECYT